VVVVVLALAVIASGVAWAVYSSFTNHNSTAALWETINKGTGEPRKAALMKLLSMDVDLTNINLKDGFFEDVHFNGKRLKGANFSESKLSGAFFDDADLAAARFAGATSNEGFFRHADLSGANLTEVNFFQTELDDTLFLDAILDRAILKQCNFRRTVFYRSSLRDVKLDDSNLMRRESLTMISHVLTSMAPHSAVPIFLVRSSQE
jgi:uncharacterized protein YjbI with pentapeptide repeats